MLRYLATGMAVFVLWGSLSCTPIVHLLAYNNTDARLEVVVKTKRIAIASGELQQIDHTHGYFVLLRNEHGPFCYKVPTVPMEYWKHTMGHAEIIFQIEADGLIYLIRPDMSLPTADLGSQPTGFPVAPLAEQAQCPV